MGVSDSLDFENLWARVMVAADERGDGRDSVALDITSHVWFSMCEAYREMYGPCVVSTL